MINTPTYTTKRRTFRRTGPLALLLALLALSACSSQQLLYQPFDEEGEPIAFKRRARFETHDFFHHWRRAVYIKVDKPAGASFASVLLADGWESGDTCDKTTTTTGADGVDTKKSCETLACSSAMTPALSADQPLSSDQKIVLAEFGAPDYIRPPFSARTREKTDEWLYLKNNLLVQFVDGFLVYSGKVTDKEHILLKRGYPLKNIRLSEIDGPFFETLVYRNRSGSLLMEYAFANDELISSVE